ncbi:MAG: hypothetical protein RIT32_9, partial [Actinomycetota bacterium]
MGPARRLLLHATGLAVSPYSDIKPVGSGEIKLDLELPTDRAANDAQLPTKLWHKSPGTGGR